MIFHHDILAPSKQKLYDMSGITKEGKQLVQRIYKHIVDQYYFCGTTPR